MKKLLFSMFALMMGFSIMTQAQNAFVAGGGEAMGNNGKMSFTIGQIAYHSFQGVDKNVNEGVQQAHPEEHLIINSLISGLGYVEEKDYTNFVKVDYNSDTLYHIEPMEGWHVDKVIVNGLDMRQISYYQFENIKEDQTIEVVFAIDHYKLTAEKIGNGTITNEGVTEIVYDPSISYPYTITPAEGYIISAILVNNEPIDLTNVNREEPYTYTFENVLSDNSIVAMFADSKYTITASSNANGVISPNGVATINYGMNSTYVAKANEGYYIAQVTIDGTATNYEQDDNMTTFEYTFNNVVANHTIDVQFAQASYNVIAVAPQNGTITPEGEKTYQYGESPVYTIVANTGFAIEDVLVDGESVGAVASYTFSNIKENHKIEATFKQLTYNIVATAGANGKINPAGTVTVNYDETKAFTITPDNGFKVATLLVDGKEITAATAYTFANVKENHTIAVTFEAITYEITATAGVGGKITPAGTTLVKHGASQSFAVVADNGYDLKTLKIDNQPVDVKTVTLPYVFENVTANHTIAAEFEIKHFTITATAGNGGTIDPAGEVTVDFGTNKQYTMKANDGFYIDYVLVDGVKIGAKESYEFKNIAANHTIEVAFLAEVCDKPLNTMTLNITDNSATLVWNGVSDKYSVAYKAADDTAYTTVADLTDTQYELTGLDEVTTYTWRVKGYCNYGEVVVESEWSTEEAFTTLAIDRTGINDVTIASVKVYGYNDKIYIENENNIAVKNVEVYDAQGRVVYVGGALTSTRTEIQLSLAAGNYVVRLVGNDNASSSHKVMLTNF